MTYGTTEENTKTSSENNSAREKDGCGSEEGGAKKEGCASEEKPRCEKA